MAERHDCETQQGLECLSAKMVALSCSTQLPCGIIRMAVGELHMDGWATLDACPCHQWAVSLLRKKDLGQTAQILPCDCGHVWIVRKFGENTLLVIGPLQVEDWKVAPSRYRGNHQVQQVEKNRLYPLTQVLDMVADAPLRKKWERVTVEPRPPENRIFPSITPYPLSVETQLLHSIRTHSHQEALSLVNDLYCHILLKDNQDFPTMKSYISALAVIMAQTVSYGHSAQEEIRNTIHSSLCELEKIGSLEYLCRWTSNTTRYLYKIQFPPKESTPNDIVTSVMAYVQHNFQEKITLDFVASVVHMSTAHLGRLFKKEAGQSFHQFLTNIRVEKSKQLLADNRLRLVDIALMVGFEDQSYFTRVFKRTTGETPLSYREQLGES